MTTTQLVPTPTNPATPHTCDSLGALCGHPISMMRREGGIVELDFSDDWEPNSVERAALREAIELGQQS